MTPRRPPGLSKIKAFPWESYTFAKNTLFNSKLAKELANASREALQEPLGEPRGAPGSLQTISFSRQEAPTRHPMNFVAGLPPPRAANKTDLKRSWRLSWAQMAPGIAPEAFWP